MTKKEKEAFKAIYNDSINQYMRFLMKGEEIPPRIVIRGLTLAELNKMFFPDEYSDENEVGA